MDGRATQPKWRPLRRLAATAIVTVTIFLPTAFVYAATGAARPQGAPAKSITLNGVVHNAGGEPIPAADIYLDDEKNTAQAHAVSSEDGSFELTVDHGGTYTVRAQKFGWGGDQSDPIELPRDANKRIELVMENSRNQNPNSATGRNSTSAPAKPAATDCSPSRSLAQ